MARVQKKVDPSDKLLAQLNVVDKWYREGNKLALPEAIATAKKLIKSYDKEWNDLQGQLFK